MKLAILLLACGSLLGFTACEDRRTEIDESDKTYQESPPPPPARQEGPAERTGRIIDQATRKAAEAVGEGLREAGKEIQEHVPATRESR